MFIEYKNILNQNRFPLLNGFIVKYEFTQDINTNIFLGTIQHQQPIEKDQHQQTLNADPNSPRHSELCENRGFN